MARRPRRAGRGGPLRRAEPPRRHRAGTTTCIVTGVDPEPLFGWSGRRPRRRSASWRFDRPTPATARSRRQWFQLGPGSGRPHTRSRRCPTRRSGSSPAGSRSIASTCEPSSRASRRSPRRAAIVTLRIGLIVDPYGEPRRRARREAERSASTRSGCPSSGPTTRSRRSRPRRRHDRSAGDRHRAARRPHARDAGDDGHVVQTLSGGRFVLGHRDQWPAGHGGLARRPFDRPVQRPARRSRSSG